MPATDRGREIGFALTVLLPVIAIAAAAELWARHREATRAPRAVDWTAVQTSIGTEMPDGMVRLRPNSRYGEMRINALGYRGPEVAIPAPPNTLRIAFVGDSKILAADLPESATLPAQTLARLARALPGCRFDYVAIAGPGYTMPMLARQWRADASRLAPDIAIILAGAPTELVGDPEADSRAAAARPPQPGLGGLLAQSAIVRFANRELRMISPATPASPAAAQPLTQLAARYRADLAPLAAAIGPTPTVAIGYRSRMGDPAAPGARLTVARHLRQSYPGLSLEKAVAISDLVVTQMRRHAQKSGWHFIDPIAAIADQPRYFTDRSHFSTSGIAHIADAVTTEIMREIKPDCPHTPPAPPP